jgi:flagella basal body P-ring formation protein FlgA
MKNLMHKTGELALLLALITLPDTGFGAVVTIDGSDVFVKDVVPECNGDYCDLTISKAPAPGQNIVIARAKVLKDIEKAGFKIRSGLVNYRTKIVRKSVKASATELEQKISLAIGSVLPKNIIIKKMGRVSAGYVPESGFEAKAFWPYEQRFGKHITVPVEFWADGEVFRKIYVPLTVAYEAEIPVAAFYLSEGYIIDESAIKIKKTETGIASELRRISRNDLIGMQLTRPLEAGFEFDKRFLKKVMIVKRGERLTIISKTGNIKITATGYAKQNGAAGDIIKVHIPTLNKILQVIVKSRSLGVVLQ